MKKASSLGKGVQRKMLEIRKNRLQWLLPGALSAGLVLAPVALVANAQQSGTAGQQTNAPAPGGQGDWGPAGPPPDAQNGQIPPPDANQAQDPNATRAEPGSDARDPGPGPNQYPNQGPDANQGPGAPGVGYGAPARPAYQPNQPSNGYQGPQGPEQAAPPSGPVTLNAGMLLQIRTSEPLDSKKVKPGDYFQGTLAQSVYVGNVLAIPRGVGLRAAW